MTIDNLKAAVKRADWYDPELNPKIIEFGRHYGVVIIPTMPFTPEHKGKVESSVKYVKNNALKGRIFSSLEEENKYLFDWEKNVADMRIHGTTRQQVFKLFEQEKPILKPLPASLFPCYQEGKRTVHRDSFVEIARAYYEAPPEYIGQEVWVRWDSHVVRIFNRRLEQIRVLARKRPGEFSECLSTRGRSTTVEHTVEHWRDLAMKIGEHCGLWADRIVDIRGCHGIRTLQGLVALTRKHRAEAVEEGCRLALANGQYYLENIRSLMKNPVEQNQFDFLSSHPLIRDMSEYKEIFQAITGNAADPACGDHDFDQRCGASRQAAVPDPAASGSTNKQEEVA
ncbi:transposase [sediment metagenome]|uniref:Transposase n=1 Tax=sediment metagenome TaxID=749907 RepID=D9PGS3_9ZZZZ